ncbi:hypothetical protein LIA77_04947 [Sarocladium implicatum]|nr:hypothetical protein LIA77_04947 [Sarocladium implicatum]
MGSLEQRMLRPQTSGIGPSVTDHVHHGDKVSMIEHDHQNIKTRGMQKVKSRKGFRTASTRQKAKAGYNQQVEFRCVGA